MTEEELLAKIIQDCITEGISVQLGNSEKVRLPEEPEEVGCSGFFCQENKLLAVATAHFQWLEVLIHEYCHFQQWKEQHPLWTNCDEEPFWEWILGPTLPPKEEAWASLTDIVALERDCEMRAVKILKQLDSYDNEDVQNYTKRANAYLISYRVVFDCHTWYREAPYQNERILKYMPPFLATAVEAVEWYNPSLYQTLKEEIYQ